MKKKKIIGLMLAVSMVLGTVACGSTNTEESKNADATDVQDPGTSESQEPDTDGESSEQGEVEEVSFEGMTLKVVDSTAEGMWMSATLADNISRQQFRYEDPLEFIGVAILEWCEANGVTLDVQIMDQATVAASIANGDVVDFVVGANCFTFPTVAVKEIAEPLTKYYDDFSETYPEDYVYAGMFQEEWYGAYLPHAMISMLYFDKCYFEERGIKSPDEYFVEGNWNWETFQKVCEELAGDTNGDGVNDVFVVFNQADIPFANPVEYDAESGLYVSQVNSDRNREFYQMVYELYSEIGVVSGLNVWSPSTQKDGSYIAIAGAQNCKGAIFERGHYVSSFECFMTVPYPARNESEAYINANPYFMYAGKGGNADMAVSVMDYVIKLMNSYYKVQCKQETVEEALGWFVPTTKGGNLLIKEAEKWEARDVYGEYSIHGVGQEYFDALSDYLQNTPYKYAHDVGIYSVLVGYWPDITTLPAASSVAKVAPIIEAAVDDFNSKYMNK